MKIILEMILLTRMTISPKRRKEIKHIVLLALQRMPDLSLPLKIKALCKSYSNIRLIPFSTHMERRNLTYKEMLEYCETSDSCVDYYVKEDKYIVYYNDIEKHNIIDSNRYRWNIAHELGHILLNHHKMNNKTRIFRSTLTNAEYDYLENEADYFTQLVLVPHIVLYAFKIQNAVHIKNLCKISNPASRKRYYEYQIWKSNMQKDDPYDKPLFFLYHDFVYKKECLICGAHLIQKIGNYCPICGNKNSLQWGDGKMIYLKLKTYDNGKLSECPICKNEETDLDGGYCQICGTYLINHCTNQNCQNAEPLPSNARYCPICGSPSIFYRDKILKEWNYKEDDLPTNDGFMNIPDGINENLSFSDINEELPF